MQNGGNSFVAKNKKTSINSKKIQNILFLIWDEKFKASIHLLYRNFKRAIFYLFGKQVIQKRIIRAGPFIIVTEYIVKKEPFLNCTPCLKILHFSGYRGCFKSRVWLFKKVLDCDLAPQPSQILPHPFQLTAFCIDLVYIQRQKLCSSTNKFDDRCSDFLIIKLIYSNTVELRLGVERG